MTLDNLRTVRMGGVSCLSDIGLYRKDSYWSHIKLLSVYGSPQEVKAILSGLVSRRTIEVSEVGEIEVSYYDRFRFRMVSLGYGKKHGLLRAESLGERMIVWFSSEERLEAFSLALSKRKIPFSPEILPDIERLLLEKEFITELSGWGGINGYECDWNDDAICNLIGERIFGRKRGEDGAQEVYREVW